MRLQNGGSAPAGFRSYAPLAVSPGQSALDEAGRFQKMLKNLMTPGSKAGNISVFLGNIEREKDVLPKALKLLTIEGGRYADIRQYQSDSAV